MAKKKTKPEEDEPKTNQKYPLDKIKPDVEYIVSLYETQGEAADAFQQETGVPGSTFISQLRKKSGYCTYKVGEAITEYAADCRIRGMTSVDKRPRGRAPSVSRGGNFEEDFLDDGYTGNFDDFDDHSDIGSLLKEIGIDIPGSGGRNRY